MRTLFLVLSAIACLLYCATRDSSEAAAPPPALTAYQQSCVNASVPLPPSFGKPAGAPWKFLGTMPNELIFASDEPQTDIWLYKATKKPLGICIALPRKDAGGTIQLLGVICQAEDEVQVGTETAPALHACFWDNVAADQTTRLTSKDITTLNPVNFLGGDQLLENCTNCHRGDNAYIAIPNTLESQADAGHVNRNGTPYVPIGQAGWLNPPGTVPLAATGGCERCHSMPALPGRNRTDPPAVKSLFCGILGNFVNTKYPMGHPDAGTLLMPPGKVGRTANQKADVTALDAACTALGAGF